MDKQGLHCIVSGKVQGVFYRAQTQQQAEKLDLTGWVCNLDSGQVEVVAYGTTGALTQLVTWLQQGPPAAIVDHVEQHTIAWQSLQDFIIK